MNVPILDLTRVHHRIASQLEERWKRVLSESSFILGPEVREFESAFASYLGVGACTGLANGTDALVLALRALGLRPGDEVIVPSFSFFATAEAVLLLGGVPVFADVGPETLNLDAEDAERRVTERTVGLLPVHLYGRPFDVDAVLALCEKRGLWMIEDAAQAQGAAWKGTRVGGFGSLAAWSFYPTKNLGCFGDGGGVTGNDKDLVAQVHRLANHGQTSRYQHMDVGTNSRLDSLQAAVLNCRLAFLEEDNSRRRELACRYHGAFKDIADLRLIPDPPGAVSVYHQFTIRTSRRDELMEHLKSKGIASSVHYPVPIHQQPVVKERFPISAGELPVSTAAAKDVLCLPIFPELTNEEHEQVCSAVREHFGA